MQWTLTCAGSVLGFYSSLLLVGSPPHTVFFLHKQGWHSLNTQLFIFANYVGQHVSHSYIDYQSHGKTVKLGGRMESHMMNVPSSMCLGWSYCLFLHPQAVLACSEALYVLVRWELLPYCKTVAVHLFYLWFWGISCMRTHMKTHTHSISISRSKFRYWKGI